MFVIQDSICVPGGPICEDAICWGSHFCAALDGASGLADVCIMETGSDAAWFSGAVSRALSLRLNAGDPRPTQELLREITAELQAEYRSMALARHKEIPSDSPSACIALFRQMGDRLEFTGLGDSVGMVRLKDGTALCSEEATLSALDGAVIDRMAELHRQTGIDVLAAREQCQDMLVAHRALKNTPEGYWILNLSGEGIAHARTLSVPLSEVEAVGVCSDGFYQLVDCFRRYGDGGALLRAMEARTLQAMTDELFAAQEQDPVCNHYPRLKFRDDTCALWGRFDPDQI